MALHPEFPASPHAPLFPEQCWFPADDSLRDTAHDELILALVASVRKLKGG